MSQRWIVKGEQCAVRAGSQNASDMSGVPLDCPVQLEDKRLQRSTAPNPTVCWRGRHRTVRCARRHQSQPMARKWLEAINTPKPPPFKSSKFSELHIHCKIKGRHSKDTFKAFNPLKAPKSTLLLRDLWEDHLCFFVALVAWIIFYNKHSVIYDLSIFKHAYSNRSVYIFAASNISESALQNLCRMLWCKHASMVTKRLFKHWYSSMQMWVFPSSFNNNISYCLLDILI
jgi:hypothetical protein